MSDEITLEKLWFKLSKLEQHIINLILPIQDLNSVFTDRDQTGHLMKLLSQPIKIDDRSFGTMLKEWKEINYNFTSNMEKIDLSKTLEEIKYIGNRLNQIEKTIKDFHEKGITKKINLEINCDGYEMVKKPAIYDRLDEIAPPQLNDDDQIRDLLSTLTERYSKVVVHRLGLLGEKKKTFKDIGKIFKVTGSRIRDVYTYALRKLRHKTREEKMKKIRNEDLIEAVYGQEYRI